MSKAPGLIRKMSSLMRFGAHGDKKKGRNEIIVTGVDLRLDYNIDRQRC